jgi:serine/threonine protein kinase
MQRYRIVQVIGSGNFGTALKCIRRSDGKEVCLKILKNGYTIAQFQQIGKEVEIMKQLHHPNLVKYFSSCWDNNQFCIETELVDGGTLHDFLKRQLTENEIVMILGQLLKGLEYLHSKNIIHRDLKLENILVMKNGQLKIADFGLSKKIPQSIVSSLTFAGTEPYMSPEMHLNHPGGKKSDIWSLAVAIYLLAVKKFPFYSPDCNQLKYLIINTNSQPIGNQFSQYLNDIISLMLSKNIYSPPSASQLLTWITQYYSFIHFFNSLPYSHSSTNHRNSHHSNHSINSHSS